jgi:hypothetical protein
MLGSNLEILFGCAQPKKQIGSSVGRNVAGDDKSSQVLCNPYGCAFVQSRAVTRSATSGNSQPVDSLQLSAVPFVLILGAFLQKRRRRRSAASRKTAPDQKTDGFISEIIRWQFLVFFCKIS